MTEAQFLERWDRLAGCADTINPAGVKTPTGCIRMGTHCPITAVHASMTGTHYAPAGFRSAAEDIGLDEPFAHRLALAADRRVPHSPDGQEEHYRPVVRLRVRLMEPIAARDFEDEDERDTWMECAL